MKFLTGIIRIVLIPISVIYSVIMNVRNFLYDKNILSACNAGAKIISIGNITTGGTGKTPFVIFIAKYFLNKGKTVGIISRGYGRAEKKMVTVYDGFKINEDINQTGDEPALIAYELSKEFSGKFYIIASADRCRASEYMMSKFKPDIIILDDAFQHRKIRRDLDIVLIDETDYEKNRLKYLFTIPSGDLRESFSNIKRADLIVLNSKHSDKSSDHKGNKYFSDTVKIKYKSEYLIDHKNTILKPDSVGNPEEEIKMAILFSGIAKPESFCNAVKSLNIKVTNEIIYDDHHNYSYEDIEKLISLYKKDTVYVTTEKDFIKIKKYKKFTDSFPVYFLNLEIEVTGNISLLESKLLDILKINKNN
ncbi:MAG TPA: tetraacyldisaccharide 4'-kinase [Ignavibacteria bacterium]|nr:tetraacyldisaccharide 4'-kinase [Bacteroidota bacterium]HRI83989.1 tetraacyldisaccharide 4'-kinase [Ignavibacteria bacterium]HRJ99186.1 tetraacyldisaccharide 4'-kinase [Ignavibacteria bacterium]